MKKVKMSIGKEQESSDRRSFPHWKNIPEEIGKGRQRETIQQQPSQKKD